MNLELRSVRIKNCGPIDDIKIDFFDASGKTLPVCVIGGANGSGKTTLLEVIWGMAGLITSQSLGGKVSEKNPEYLQVDWTIGQKDFSQFYGIQPKYTILSQENCGLRRDPQSNSSFNWQGTPFYSDLRQRIFSQQNNDGGSSRSTRGLPDDKVPSIIYLPHNRSLEPVYGQQLQKESDRYEFIRRIEAIKQFPGSLTSYLIWLEYSDTERFHQMQTFLNNLDFDGKTFHVNRKELDVFVKTADRHEHRLHELSSGEQNLLIILIELYRKLLPGSVVLIDEIENSLHPAYQHRLAQGLLALQKEIPYQLIVTTHAPAFVEIFGEENTRLLTPF